MPSAKPKLAASPSNQLENRFCLAISALGPFEDKPRLIVGVSGGSDSLALTFLADQWVRNLGGSVVGVTIDHALHSVSAEHSALVRVILNEYGIDHLVRRRHEKILSTRIQALARRARYDLLGKVCRELGILHLLIAHHAADQRETIVMRGWQGSGDMGRSGMTAVREFSGFRLLRPLLAIEPHELKVYLKKLGVNWLEDPSNANGAFLRVRARSFLKSSTMRSTSRLQIKRQVKEQEIANWLSRNATISPAGYIVLNRKSLKCISLSLQASVLSRAIVTTSGTEYAPATKSLLRIARHVLARGSDRTLGGCLIRCHADTVIVFREFGRQRAAEPLPAGRSVRWDGRFRVQLASSAGGGYSVAPVGEEGLRQIFYGVSTSEKFLWPLAACRTLPGLWVNGGIVAAPHLGYNRLLTKAFSAVFEPNQCLVQPSFAVVFPE